MTKIQYQSGASAHMKTRRRRRVVFFAALVGYAGVYFVLRDFVKPAANMAFIVYPGPAIVDQCCYYGFWPLYKMDRLLTGRKHNLDRTSFNPADVGP